MIWKRGSFSTQIRTYFLVNCSFIKHTNISMNKMVKIYYGSVVRCFYTHMLLHNPKLSIVRYSGRTMLLHHNGWRWNKSPHYLSCKIEDVGFEAQNLWFGQSWRLLVIGLLLSFVGLILYKIFYTRLSQIFHYNDLDSPLGLFEFYVELQFYVNINIE